MRPPSLSLRWRARSSTDLCEASLPPSHAGGEVDFLKKKNKRQTLLATESVTAASLGACTKRSLELIQRGKTSSWSAGFLFLNCAPSMDLEDVDQAAVNERDKR